MAAALWQLVWFVLLAAGAGGTASQQAAALRGRRAAAAAGRLAAADAPLAPPGDVSGVGDVARRVHEAAGAQAVKVAGDFGGLISDQLGQLASSAEAAIVDPVGTVGDAVNSAAESLESELALPTAAPEGVYADRKVPESPENIADYSVTPVTPPPAPYAGVYCRGAACQYRNQPFPIWPPPPPPGLPEPEEPCRGIGCPAPPMAPERLAFEQGCVHIFSKARNGLQGDDESRTIGDVRSTFAGLCATASPLEAAACPDYAEVFVGALAPDVREVTVGGTAHVCSRLFEFVTDMLNSGIQLGLTTPAGQPSMLVSLGGGARSAANSTAAAGGGGGRGVGPCSARGRRWRQWWSQRHSTGSAPAAVSLLAASPPNAPCTYGVSKPPAVDMKYQVLPGSEDGVIPPFEVSGGLFTTCLDQAAEISLGYAQTAPTMAQMVRDWCGFQSLAAAPGDPSGLPRHPEWEFRDCTVMGQFMTFATRKDLASGKGVSPVEVCKKMFLGLRTVSGVHRLVNQAWSGGRVPQVGGSAPGGAGAAVDPAMKKLAAEAAKKAKEAINRLKKQQAATAAVSSSKAAVAAWAAR